MYIGVVSDVRVARRAPFLNGFQMMLLCKQQKVVEFAYSSYFPPSIEDLLIRDRRKVECMNQRSRNIDVPQNR